MGNPALKLAERFTYAQYRTWPDEERWELIDGVAWMMAAPSIWHQELQARIFTDLRNLLKGKPCRAFVAPVDVLIPKADEADDEVDSVVQPDIVVFCDGSRIREDNARGAPDLVVEILSPSTSKKDQNEKFRLYERAGVREYWVVDPAGQWLCVYRLGANGLFDEGELRESLRESRSDNGPIASRVLEGFAVDPSRLFAELE